MKSPDECSAKKCLRFDIGPKLREWGVKKWKFKVRKGSFSKTISPKTMEKIVKVPLFKTSPFEILLIPNFNQI